MNKKTIILSIWLIIVAGKLCFPNAETVVSAEKPDFKVIIGEWVRPNGGYIIHVRDIKPDGSVDAGYFNALVRFYCRTNLSKSNTDNVGRGICHRRIRS